MLSRNQVYWCGVCRRVVPDSQVRGDWREGWEHTGGPCMGAEVYQQDAPSTAGSGIHTVTTPI